MSLLCVVGAALVAQASARSFDWDRYMQEYAGDYYKGSENGEFAGYVDRYVQGYGAQAKSFAHDYSQDRLAQANQYQDKYEGQYAPANAQKMAQPMLLEATASSQNASDPVSTAFAAQHSAAQQAEASISELRSWDSKLVQDLQDKSFSATVAKGIVTKVQTTFLKQREDLQHSFNAAMQALDAKSLATADSSDVKAAEKSAKKAKHELEHLDHEEAHAMRATLRSIQKAGKVKARTLWKDARKAAREVYKNGMRGAKAQRKAGERERVYEQSMLDSEESSEKLLGRAEEAAEKAEGLVEKQFDKVEEHLEAMVENNTRTERETRRQRVHQAKEAVHQAKKAAEEKAAEEKAAEASKQTASPSVFLARASSQDFGTALIAPLACVAMLAAMTTLLTLRFCRGGVAMEHPLLG